MITTSSLLTDEEFSEEDSNIDNDNDTEDDKELVALSKSDAENSFEIMKNFCLFSEKGSHQMQYLMNLFETLITTEKKKQKTVKKYL